jgi:hypothetical protein
VDNDDSNNSNNNSNNSNNKNNKIAIITTATMLVTFHHHHEHCGIMSSRPVHVNPKSVLVSPSSFCSSQIMSSLRSVTLPFVESGFLTFFAKISTVLCPYISSTVFPTLNPSLISEVLVSFLLFSCVLLEVSMFCFCDICRTFSVSVPLYATGVIYGNMISVF